jgi:hypothetical protein
MNKSVEYFSWTESARLIFKIRKKMNDEGMKEGSKSLIQNEKATRIYDEYEKLFYEENFRILHKLEFDEAMKYMLHSQYIEEERFFMYEDDFIPIFERIYAQG